MTDDTMPDWTDDLFLTDVVSEDPRTQRATLSFSRTPTVLLNLAANKFTQKTSHSYQSRFGIGAMDWRMLVMLTRHPGSTVIFASSTIGIDKASVSRSLLRLQKQELATFEVEGNDDRRKSWYLSPKGADLHDTVLQYVLSELRIQLKGFSAAEISQLNALLKRFLENLE